MIDGVAGRADPAQSVRTSPVIHDALPPQHQRMEKPRLLILDDEETVGKLLVFVAQGAGFEARHVDRADGFFAAVDEWAPTHLAIDLAMPEMSGVEVMRKLAASGCTALTIISSGAGDTETEAALQHATGLGLRMAGVLSKPFSLSSLRALLAEI
jgi:CheY-like chemotaxis protein